MGFIVGLTGGIGSGKSTVASEFARFDIQIVDADVIARQVVASGSAALHTIVNHFGTSALQADGSLNRCWLRDVIFSQPKEKDWLNALLHPIIYQQTRLQLAQTTSPYVLWVAPLLLENGWQHEVNRILVVDVPVATQIARTMQRDSVSRSQIKQILASQMGRSKRRSFSDDIINNTDSLAAMQVQVRKLHYRYLDLAAQIAHKEST